MLSQDRNNLSLWCTYARVLRSQRKAEEARQVYRLCSSFLDVQVHKPQDIEHLFSEWAELEWLAGRNDDLLSILVATVTSDYQVPQGIARPLLSVHFQLTLKLLRAREAIACHVSQSEAGTFEGANIISHR